MDEKFFRQWLQGFENGLEAMDSEARSCLLGQCARKCADTGVLQAYKQLHKAVQGDRNAFYTRMEELGDARGEIVVTDREYHVYFPKCSCDLHTTGGVNTPKLCECSRQSILYVGQAIWKGESFRVEQVETILSGAKECKFKIIID